MGLGLRWRQARLGDGADGRSQHTIEPAPSVDLVGLASAGAERERVAGRREALAAGGAVWLERLTLGGIVLLGLVLRTVRLDEAGTGNSYYAAAVRSMLASWWHFFYLAFDPAGFLAVDKPPLALWLQAASARLFGFQGLSLLLPQVAAGLVTVGLLWWLVRRSDGPAAGLIAALALATTPVSVVTDRTNQVDSVLVPFLLLAAWAGLAAAERGSPRLLLVGAVSVGLGFNVKMLAAYLPLPALFLPYLLAAPLAWPRRLLHLALAGAVVLAVSLSWALAVELTPPERRPYVGSTADNSMLNLIVVHNGLQRLWPGRLVSPSAAATTNVGSDALPPGVAAATLGSSLALEIGEPGPGRLLGAELGGQVSWLFPPTLGGLLGALWERRGAGGWRARPVLELLLWSVWLATGLVFFSLAGFFHRYYLVLLAPPLAALVGSGGLALWRLYRGPGRAGWLLPLTLLATAVLQLVLLAAAPEWSERLGPPLALLVLVGVLGLLLARRRTESRRLAAAALGVGGAALLLAPLTWAAISLGQDDPLRRILPYAGPVRASSAAAPASPSPLALAADPALTRFLAERRGGAVYALGAPSALIAAPFILRTGQAVMTYGGYLGGDPILSVEQLAVAVAAGQVRYFLLPLAPPPVPGQPLSKLLAGIARQPQHLRWLREHCPVVPAEQWRSTPPRAPGGLTGAGAGEPPGQEGGRSGPGFTLQLLDCGGS